LDTREDCELRLLLAQPPLVLSLDLLAKQRELLVATAGLAVLEDQGEDRADERDYSDDVCRGDDRPPTKLVVPARPASAAGR